MRKVVFVIAALSLTGCVRMGHGIFGDCADCFGPHDLNPAAAMALVQMGNQISAQSYYNTQNTLSELQHNLAIIGAGSRPVTVAPFSCMSMGGGMVSCH